MKHGSFKTASEYCPEWQLKVGLHYYIHNYAAGPMVFVFMIGADQTHDPSSWGVIICHDCGNLAYFKLEEQIQNNYV